MRRYVNCAFGSDFRRQGSIFFIGYIFVSVPANGKFVLKDLLVEIPILENLSNMQSLVKITGIKDIQIETILGVLGKEYSIIQ